MINPVMYYDTHMTDEVIDMIYQSVDRSLSNYQELKPATSVIGKNKSVLDPWRNCSDAPISSFNWFAGMIWHHISRANNLNFDYDITCFDNDHINFIRYQPDQYYHWHSDDIPSQAEPIPNQTIFKSSIPKTVYRRKLSFTLFLNDDYTGGEFQIMPRPKMMCQVPPKKGALVVFDSRAWHRVRKVKSGTRDVLVGWAIGPTWK